MASDSSQDPSDASLRPNWQGVLPTGADPLFVGIGAICDTAARLTGSDGAALAVLTPTRGVRELVYATDAMAQQIDEVQFTMGEGPCLDAYHEDRPQLCAQLDDKTLARWPAFSAELVGLDVAALFAFPVPGQHRPMGVLELSAHRRRSQRRGTPVGAALCRGAAADAGVQLGRSSATQHQRRGGHRSCRAQRVRRSQRRSVHPPAGVCRRRNDRGAAGDLHLCRAGPVARLRFFPPRVRHRRCRRRGGPAAVVPPPRRFERRPMRSCLTRKGRR